MYFHLDDRGYKVAEVGVATCDRPDGAFKYVKRFRPLGHESRDIGQFIDDDGTSYLVFEDRPFGFRIARLSKDYMDVEKEMTLVKAHMEGGAIVHYKGLYYSIGSALTGWNANPNKYSTAPTLECPWTEFKDIAPVATNTYGSQSTMLKLTDHLFSWTADAKYADYYERALYNHILGSQDPETGMVCYFMPLKSGTFKVYSTENDSYWCCVGTGFENHAKYGEAIYFHDNNNLYVNLFIPSELTWREKGIQIRQETRYPEKENSKLTILATNGEKYALLVRFPAWATSGVKVKINGSNQIVKNLPGSYIHLERKWKKGDVIELTLPMQLRLIPVNDNPNLAAIAYGLVVLAGAMGKEGMGELAPFAEDQDDLGKFPVPASIKTTVNTDGKRVTDMVKRVDGKSPLTFEIRDAHQEKATLVTYYQIHDERYVIYWKLKGR